MGKVLAIAAIVVGLAAAGFGIYHYFWGQEPTAGLKVLTNPASTVFVDNVQVGSTPIDQKFRPGEVTVKIIPNSTTGNLTTYQTKVRLSTGTYSVIRRDFAASDAATAGDTISLESTSDQGASLAVVASGPDAASVILDGEPVGFTPLVLTSINPGDHQVTISAPGFALRTINALAVTGYKLVLNVKLAGLAVEVALPEVDLSDKPPPASSSAGVIKKPYVEVKDTPTGFLRVRQEPSVVSKELGQVKPGDKLPLLESFPGWYRVSGTFTATSSGWISGQYADKFE